MQKEKTIWMFNEFEFKEVKEGDKVEIQIMRKWEWKHPTYWNVKVDENTLNDVIKNFEENKRWIDLAVDENHEQDHKALWWIKELKKKWEDKLFATIEITKKGADLISQWAYKYFSPEIIFNKKDEETWETIKNLLIGWAFTNRPFFKAMNPLMASEWEPWQWWIDRKILFFNTNSSMKTILDLLAKFAENQKLDKEEKELLVAKFSELSEDDKTKELTEAVNEATKEEEKKIEASEKEVNISFSELENLRKMASQTKELLDEKRKFSFNEKIKSISFSEGNKVWLVLPKMVDEVSKFAFSLNEEQEKQFFNIIEKLQTVSLWEMWTSKEWENINVDVVNFYTEKFWLDKEEAEKLAKTITI